MARAALQKLIVVWSSSGQPTITRWRSQASGTDDARPDLQGSTDDGQPVAIFENKFWAGLTKNQPETYLARLPSDRGIVVFVAPGRRIEILQREVAKRARECGELVGPLSEVGTSWVGQLTSGRTLAVTAWATVLDAIGSALEAAAESETLADLRQLKGLADKMELEGFHPFSATDLTGNAGQLVVQACGIVDQALGILGAEGAIDRSGLRTAGSRAWYGSGFRMNGYGCNLIFSAERWARLGQSPIWLRVSSAKWSFHEQAASALHRTFGITSPVEEVRSGIWTGVLLPIRILEGQEERTVVDSVVSQVKAVAALLPPEGSGSPVSDPVPEPADEA